MMDQLDERITKLENELNHLKQMKENCTYGQC